LCYDPFREGICVRYSRRQWSGSYLTNDTGQTVYGLTVTFSEPVTITSFGDELTEVNPAGEATEFIFSGGQVSTSGGQWLNWKPTSAQLLHHRWIIKDADSLATGVQDPLTGAYRDVAKPNKPWSTGQSWHVEYNELFFDDFETLANGLASGLMLAEAGDLTDDTITPISGECSIVGRHSGPGQYRPYLRSDPASLPLSANHTYKVGFDYKILETPDIGFETLFYSPKGGGAGRWLPSRSISGVEGDTGRVELRNQLLNYDDYELRWNVVSNGSIVIDNIELIDLTDGVTVLTEGCEAKGPSMNPQLRFLSDGTASLTSDSLYQAGEGTSVILTDLGAIVSDPTLLHLPGGATYIVEFDYKRIRKGNHDRLAEVWLQLAGKDPWLVSTSAQLPFIFNHEPERGTYQGGIAVPPAGDYYLVIRATDKASISIDNLRVMRQNTVTSEAYPQHWDAIAAAPFPRLGNYLMGTTQAMAYGDVEGTRFMYSVADIERQAAFSDVVAGFTLFQQTRDPAFAKRMRELNPNIVLLPYRIAGEAGFEDPDWGRQDSGVEIEEDYMNGIADEWIVKTADGGDAGDLAWTFIKKLNIYDSCPLIDGMTFNDYLANHIVEDVVKSGVWDGIYIDNLFARINPHITNWSKRDLLDFDINNNGLRDETPAQISDKTRASAIDLLTRARQEVGANTLIVGNTGPSPQLALAPYVNGFLFECFNMAWCYECGGMPTETGWRRALNDYLYMSQNVQWPAINIVEGCGVTGAFVDPDKAYPSPQPEDFQKHRMTLGTALLGDGFYEYDLFEGRSAPYWFDEYTVDGEGKAVQDARFKGYLGQALGEAVELRSPERVIWSQRFSGNSLPSDMWAYPDPEAKLVQGGRLLLSNQGHFTRTHSSASTDSSKVRLYRGRTYVVVASWRIVETVDSHASIGISGGGFEGSYLLPGMVQGDAGTARFPVVLDAGSNFALDLVIGPGEGVVAFDNIQIIEGGAGPWRRDFENGFLLVNPLPEPYTFTQSELSGCLGRTGIKRINGSQDRAVNNGKRVNGELTLAPFDAIILLSDSIKAPGTQSFAEISAVPESSGQDEDVEHKLDDSFQASPSNRIESDVIDNPSTEITHLPEPITTASAGPSPDPKTAEQPRLEQRVFDDEVLKIQRDENRVYFDIEGADFSELAVHEHVYEVDDFSGSGSTFGNPWTQYTGSLQV